MRDTTDPPSWPDIHDLEVREQYPEAIDALESRLAADPAEAEAVIRLGFNLWYAVAEDSRMYKSLPVEPYAGRFMDLYNRYSAALANNADFCWAFGLGMSLFWFYFPGATEEKGNQLLERARTLEPRWAHLFEQGVDLSRLKGRGIFSSYYNVT